MSLYMAMYLNRPLEGEGRFGFYAVYVTKYQNTHIIYPKNIYKFYYLRILDVYNGDHTKEGLSLLSHREWTP